MLYGAKATYSRSLRYISIFQVPKRTTPINYDHRYVAKNNSLEFAGQADSTYQYEISGFSGSQVALYDITDPHSVARIVNTTVAASSSGYKLIFQQTEGAASRNYLALTSDQYKSPNAVRLGLPVRA